MPLENQFTHWLAGAERRPAGSYAAMYTTLTSAQALAADLPGIRILDCRGRLNDPGYGAAAHAEQHIPGAIHADLDRDFAGPAGSKGRHPLPDQQTLAASLRTWGINDDDQVVLYDDAGGAFAARAWWCLRWLGHPGVALLDGGLGAWPGPWSNVTPAPTPAPAPAPTKGNFSIRPTLTRSIDVAALTVNLQAHQLVDARSLERFNGEAEPIDAVAGHIPGALCLPFQDNLDAQGFFKSPTVLKARFAGFTPDVVCYCGSGVTAAHNVLAMRIAGLAEPVLYPGSWSEWIVDPTRPIAP